MKMGYQEMSCDLYIQKLIVSIEQGLLDSFD